jgi:prepilin-type N-terminal cleavage/methylation domain-containing protein
VPLRQKKMKKAFTLIELIVAIGILAIVLSFAGVIFKISIESQRMALANAEIMQKLRAITDQLNADFKGLRKDGEIFVVWNAVPVGPDDADYDHDGYVRFDRIMFFAEGDFQSYNATPKVIHGNLARICYMLANSPAKNPGDEPIRPAGQKPQKRLLARNLHILTADPDMADFFDPRTFSGTDQQWYNWNNRLEYDRFSLEQWKNIPWVINPDNPAEPNKPNMLSIIADVKVANNRISEKIRGAMVNPADANSIHMLLCDGVGEFKVQGWYEGISPGRWLPEVDPDGDGNLKDTHFILDPKDSSKLHSEEVPAVLYPYPPNGVVRINNINYPKELINETQFNRIPGLGRALKFSFTLYDSKGVIKKGLTFTHIVYLD